MSKQVHVKSYTTHIKTAVIMPFQGSKQTPYWRWLAYKVLCRGLTPFPINQILHHNHTALHLLHYYAYTIYNLCHNAYIVSPLLSTPENNICIKHTYPYHISTILYIHSEKTGHNVISLHTIWCFKLLKPMYTGWSKLCNHLSHQNPSIANSTSHCTKTVRPPKQHYWASCYQ